MRIHIGDYLAIRYVISNSPCTTRVWWWLLLPTHMMVCKLSKRSIVNNLYTSIFKLIPTLAKRYSYKTYKYNPPVKVIVSSTSTIVSFQYYITPLIPCLHKRHRPHPDPYFSIHYSRPGMHEAFVLGLLLILAMSACS